jgi:hypothetical protein
MPPWSEIWSMLWLVVAPGFGASNSVMFAVRRVGGERLSALASALAIAIGVFVANEFRKSIVWRIDPDRQLNQSDLRTALSWSLESKPVRDESETADPQDDLPLKPARYWLPWAAALVMLVELFLQIPRSPVTAGWVLRAIVAMFVGRLLTPASFRIEAPWVSWALGMTIILEWAVVVSLAREWNDGAVAAAISIACSGGGLVLIHAHIGSLMDSAMYFSVALMGPAIVATIWRGNTAPALAAAIVILPGVMFSGQQTHDSKVPLKSFALAALAPLALAILLLPRVSRQQGWRRWLLVLLTISLPTAIAVAWAAEVESLPDS